MRGKQKTQGKPRPDIAIARFDGDDWDGWVAKGEAFSDGPAHGPYAEWNQPPIEGFRSSGFANSFYGNQYAVGILTSPELLIERRYINFLLAGITHPTKLCVSLMVGGKEVRCATPVSAVPTGRHRWTDIFQPVSFDTHELEGQTAQIAVRDDHENGYILADDFVQSDDPTAVQPVDDVPRWEAACTEVVADARYLMLPVCQRAPLQEISMEIEGTPVLDFTLQLALGDIDGFVPVYDVSDHRGENVSLRYHAYCPEIDGPKARFVDRIRENDTDASSRPGFHITPRLGFLNDPNGLLYADGAYHLFHQYAIFNMRSSHWAHWTSSDLVHWEERPIALFPDTLGSMHSGSAVVDHDNTARFGRSEADTAPIVAVFTGSRGMGGTRKIQVQGLAYSIDGGKTFRKYEGNPVIGTERGRIMDTDNNRDPKVFWYEPGKHWVMVLFEGKGLSIFTSDDLKCWEFQSHQEGFHECPELFELSVDGNHNRRKWILYGGSGRYLLGSFDGRRFVPDFAEPVPLSSGNAFYASQTFNDIPDDDGRRVLVAWMAEQLSFPILLTLRETAEGVRMYAAPVREIELLYSESCSIESREIAPESPLQIPTSGGMYDIELKVRLDRASGIELMIQGVPVAYDAAKKLLSCAGKEGLLSPDNGYIDLRIVVDRLSLEIFAGEGLVYMPMGVRFDPGIRGIAVRTLGASAHIESLSIHTLRSMSR